VAVRMRFGSESLSPARPYRPDGADVSGHDATAEGEPTHHEPAADDEPSREGEPVPVGAGAQT
jgi:hypothetical protein